MPEITQRQFVVGVALMTARTCSALPIGEVGRQQKLPQSAADGRPPGTSGTSTYLKRAYRRTGFYGFGRIPLMRPWTAAHHHDDALPLQLTTFALCATHLEPRVSFCTFARAEPPQACRIRPGTVRYKHCAAKLSASMLVCIGVPRALGWKRHGGVEPGTWGSESPGSSLVDRSSRVAPPAPSKL
ncbi:hypothetical protein N5P37_002481 [Trichoderma harzianum]|nr:hypothetical protein N5P37_002481 [Trichoderma harzianum]